MKKILFLIPAFLFAYQFSNAQTQKETQTLGLYLDYNHSSDNSSYINSVDGSSVVTNNRYTRVNIGPSYSYFIAEGSELGANLSYGTNKSNNIYIYNGTNTSNSQDINTYGGSIYFKKYVLFQNKFGFRTGPFASYQYEISKNAMTPNLPATDRRTFNSYEAGGTFELVYYPLKKMGLAATIANFNYTHVTASGDANYKDKQNNFNFNFINNGLYLSVFYVIGKI